jgi:hypothetical protein
MDVGVLARTCMRQDLRCGGRRTWQSSESRSLFIDDEVPDLLTEQEVGQETDNSNVLEYQGYSKLGVMFTPE